MQADTDVEIPSQNKSKETYNPRKNSRLQQDIDREMLKALSSSNTAPDEDGAVYISIIPAVRRMSEEEKLDFSVSVMQLIKDINNRRNERPVFETTFSSASTSTSRTATPLSSLSAIWTLTKSVNCHTYYKLTNFHITQNVIVALT